jgi:hypothetical protein
MKTIAGGDIDIKVGVVHPMEAPEDREEMKQQVLQINHEIQGCHSQDGFDPGWQGEDVQDTPSLLLRHHGHSDRKNRDAKTNNGSIDNHQRKVSNPTAAFVVSQHATGSNGLPDGDNRQRAEE